MLLSSKKYIKHFEMMRNCLICKRQSGESMTLLSFPENENNKIQWAAFCKIKSQDLKTTDRLCSLHFDSSAFKNPFANSNSKRLKVKPDAVPTIFDTLEISPSTLNRNNEKANRDILSQQKNVLYCCLCGVLNSKIPRFRFPIHDPEATEKWLAVCGKKKQDLNVNSQRVCMKHFQHDDFLERSNEKQRLLLKPRAVPVAKSNQLENKIHRNENLEKPSASDINGSSLHSSCTQIQKYAKPVGNEDSFQESSPSQINSYGGAEAGLTYNVMDDSEENETTKNVSRDTTPDPLQEDLIPETPRSTKRRYKLSQTTGYLPTPRTPATSPITLSGKYPRYLKEINTADCGGSKKAEMILDVARKDLARSRQCSRKLAQQNRRLHKKVMKMEETIRELKNQKCLSGQSLSDIVVCGRVELNARAVSPRVRVNKGNVIVEPQPLYNARLAKVEKPIQKSYILDHNYYRKDKDPT